MITKLIINDREIEVRPETLIYSVNGTDKSELTISIEDRADRDYVFTNFVREKIKKARRHG